jgi:hypothetical protein
MGTIEKTLLKAKRWGAQSGWAYLATYREASRLTMSQDEVVVQLKRELFYPKDPPDEIRVKVEWNGDGGESTPLPTSTSASESAP